MLETVRYNGIDRHLAEVHGHVIEEILAYGQASSDERLSLRVEVLGPTLTLDKLRRAITTRCLDRLARP